MGIWNSHTSVGNILGSLIAGVWVNEQWGLSFVVPGVITAAMGVITFFFLIECEWTPPSLWGSELSSPFSSWALGEGSWLEGEDYWSRSRRTRVWPGASSPSGPQFSHL